MGGSNPTNHKTTTAARVTTDSVIERGAARVACESKPQGERVNCEKDGRGLLIPGRSCYIGGRLWCDQEYDWSGSRRA